MAAAALGTRVDLPPLVAIRGHQGRRPPCYPDLEEAVCMSDIQSYVKDHAMTYLIQIANRWIVQLSVQAGEIP